MPFDTDYKYVDLEHLYTDKDTGVLLNLQNISDASELVAFESLCVANRLEQLHKNPIKIEYANDLLKIHAFLFQDVYSWAGNLRTNNYEDLIKLGDQIKSIKHIADRIT